jgi:hypothetical protein
VMGFLKREEKPQEKVKAAKASLPSHVADTSMTCFKCGKPGHLWKECKEGKSDSPQSGGYCSGCGAKGHSEAKCWKLHPDLKPTLLVKWASSLFATSWYRGSISFLLLLPELSMLEIVWCKWICFHFCHFILCV